MSLLPHKTKFTKGVSISTTSKRIKSSLCMLLRDKLEEKCIKCSFYSFAPDVFFFKSQRSHYSLSLLCTEDSLYSTYTVQTSITYPFREISSFSYTRRYSLDTTTQHCAAAITTRTPPVNSYSL